MGLSKSDPIIIVGAGSFGLSAALHLSQRGYTDILVFGKDNHAPSGDLSIVYRTAQDAGVQFFLGQQVDEIVYVSTLTGRKNAGIRTQDGRFYRSALVIIEAGAGDSQSMPAIDPMHDSLATPLSWYTNLSHSLVDYVPKDPSVILLSGNSGYSEQGSRMFSLVGSLVLDLLGATSDQPIAVEAQELSEILPQKLSRL
ncbi:hypothetical protein N7522_003664 [Penicillium canescens]|uniref:uncharacterized protein n=1 Tax=Penicillium canescens TaxID=5083 RepID=UPI0026DEBAB3|nr:uncharacterized protein N7446_003558 [Penicillium canescens]KAJ6008648.1 hypothetical protein N7522_003664 [Penicillium canescens]KAJ6066521.1 hypothetical protein N7446_003558 [Penicillium canescens]KAJ6174133.1 hypothetical protein N7485_006945 [Penicillium canescens]